MSKPVPKNRTWQAEASGSGRQATREKTTLQHQYLILDEIWTLYFNLKIFIFRLSQVSKGKGKEVWHLWILKKGTFPQYISH